MHRTHPPTNVIWILLAAAILFTHSSARGQTLVSPARIVFSPDGNLWVSDFMARAVFELDSQNLEVLRAVPVGLREPGRPLGVAVIGESVLASDEISGEVVILDPRKNQVRVRGVLGQPHGRGGRTGLFTLPHELAVDEALGLVFALDVQGKLIRVFDSEGNYLYRIVPSAPVVSTGKNELLLPTSIAVDPHRQELLVSDYGDPTGTFQVRVPARILFFSYAGVYLGQVGGDGKVEGVVRPELQFFRPQGLAVDGRGYLYLVECLMGEVFVFDRNIRLDNDSLMLVGKLGGYGNEPGQLRFPLDVAVHPQTGDVFVTNNRLGRVEAFRGGVDNGR